MRDRTCHYLEYEEYPLEMRDRTTVWNGDEKEKKTRMVMR